MAGDEPSHAPSDRPDAAILVVDDNAAKRLAIRTMLAPLGQPIVEADSGRAALRAVMGQTFAVILMDVRMPTMNGYETAQLIRQRSQSELTPILFVTGFGSDDTETASAYASGAVDFIFTPVDPDVVRAKVSFFVELFIQSQELQRSLEAITALNTTLRDSEVRTQAVLDNVADGILILDQEGVVVSVNRSAGQLFGYRGDEPIGQPFTFVMALGLRAEGEHVALEQAPESTETSPRLRTTETVGRRQDGSTFPMEIERSEMKHGDQRFTLACIRDISERAAYTEALKQSRSEVIERLALAAEFRDDDTHQHAKRIGRTAALLATTLGLTSETVELLHRAAPLHDVGKIAIPDAILLKPGKLTAEEFQVIQSHTTVGAHILSGGHSELMILAQQIALSHHERWDGSGYPAGAAGEDIPVAGRIVAVADVFDALTHERPYKAAWPVERALEEVIAQRGRHFDPEVVDAFEGLDHTAIAEPAFDDQDLRLDDELADLTPDIEAADGLAEHFVRGTEHFVRGGRRSISRAAGATGPPG